MLGAMTKLSIASVLTICFMGSPLVAQSATEPSPQVSAGRELAQSGSGDVPACFGCHGPQGEGDGERIPIIAGQPAKYVVGRLHEFKERARTTAPRPFTMTAVSTTLSEAQIEDLAAYLSQLTREHLQ